MQTTINIDEKLLATAQAIATSTGRTLDEVVDEALRRALNIMHTPTSLAATTSKSVEGITSVPFVTYGTGGLKVNLDLDDSSAVSDFFDTQGD